MRSEAGTWESFAAAARETTAAAAAPPPGAPEDPDTEHVIVHLTPGTPNREENIQDIWDAIFPQALVEWRKVRRLLGGREAWVGHSSGLELGSLRGSS